MDIFIENKEFGCGTQHRQYSGEEDSGSDPSNGSISSPTADGFVLCLHLNFQLSILSLNLQIGIYDKYKIYFAMHAAVFDGGLSTHAVNL